MAWPEWNLDIPQEIARFVHAKAALRAGLRPRNAGDLADDPPALIEAIYQRLRDERLGYSSTVLGDHGNQLIQTPGEVLTHRTPNCVDLSTLVASVCLSADLVPLIALVKKADNTRHALVWVVPNASTRARRSTDLGPVGGRGLITRVGVAECAELLAVADGQGWIPVETTGVAESAIWSNSAVDDAASSLDFAASVDAAHRVLQGATRLDVVDVHALQADGLRPYDPPELVARRNRRRQVAVGSLSVVAAIAALLVWSPWDTTVPGQPQMTGGFNIALTELDTEGDGDLEDPAREIPRQLAGEVARILDGDETGGSGRFQVWGPEETKGLATDDAAAAAASINADMLVYGSVAQRGSNTRNLDVEFAVDTTQHSAKAPWPMTLSDEFTTVLATADVEAGTLGNVPAVSAFGFTLDAITALVADRFERADERLRAAQEQLGSQADSIAMIPALRAWLLLVQAGNTSDPTLVDEARPLIDAALRADPTSEFARLVELSADYLDVIPVPSGTATISCNPTISQTELPVLPDVADVRALIQRFRQVQPSFSATGQTQIGSLLGRLEFAAELDGFVTTGSFDPSSAVAEFDAVVEAHRADPESLALTIWAADAHSWLGNLAGVSTSTSAEDLAAHYLRAAALATPLYESRHYASAALAHCTRADGSPQQAVCLFGEAAELARGRSDDDVVAYESAIAEVNARRDPGEALITCPDSWEAGPL